MAEHGLVGVGVGMVADGEIVWREGFGYADLANETPFTPRTSLPIGSVTKPLTVLGVMQLHERGLIDIDQPLSCYLPEFSIRSRGVDLNRVTVRSVVAHTSGLPHDIFLNASE